MSKKRKNRKRKRKIHWIRLLIALLVPALIIGGLAALIVQEVRTEKEEPAVESSSDPVYLHPYDWAYLSHNDGLYSYEDDSFTSMPGIDVSYSQEDIDWQKVYESGIRFVMIRAGYRGYTSGQLHEDKWFRENLDEARAAGLKVGVYWFSQAVNEEEAREDADYVLSLTEGEKLDLPVGFDMEYVTENDRIKDLDQEALTSIALAFVERMKKNDHETMVYGSKYWLNELVSMRLLQEEAAFWLASYNEASPSFSHNYIMWQYSSTGSVDGIEGNVDLDLLFVPKQESDLFFTGGMLDENRNASAS